MTIKDIKQNIEAFELVPCGLKHELVKLDADSKRPIKHSISDKNQYQRIELCSLSDRNKRLGCAHSASNARFNRLIDQLETDDDIVIELQKNINAVIFKIYMLDHKKGDLEKEYAICLDKNITTQKIKEQLNECITLHKTYINNLKDLKNSLITLIDTMLLSSNKK